VEELGLLCLSGETDVDVWRAALRYAETRRAFLLVDPPGVEAERAIGLRKALGEEGGAGGALCYPPILVADPLAGGELRPCSPSGAVAGMYARTDRARGVWKAPAGEHGLLTDVAGVAVELNEDQISGLSASGVNCVLRLLGRGIVVWGARTLASSDSEWKYVNVRRLFLYLEQSIERGTQWAVFEPSDEPLWQRVRLQCGLFLDGLFRAGA
jgi:hypothetical protein